MAVEGHQISSINQGIVVLVGIAPNDVFEKDAHYLYILSLHFHSLTHLPRSKKLLSLRLFDDEQGRPWRKSVAEANLEVLLGMSFVESITHAPFALRLSLLKFTLVVSQFTLYASVKKGRKPDFHGAMSGNQAKEYFSNFVELVRKEYSQDKVKGELLCPSFSVLSLSLSRYLFPHFDLTILQRENLELQCKWSW